MRIPVLERRIIRLPRLAACALLMPLLLGCGSDYPATVPVSGRVTLGGQPVSEGSVMFYPESGRPAMGNIKPDGTYTLTTFEALDGALPGKHRVTIKAKRVAEAAKGSGPKSVEDELSMAKEGKSQFVLPTKIEWLIPERYSDRKTSPLTAEVTADSGPINFDIPAGK